MRVRILCVLFFVAWTAESDSDIVLYFGLWRSPFQILGPLFDSLPIVQQPAWNLLLLAAAPLCLLHAGAFRRRARPMDLAVLGALIMIGLGVVWGVARGGSAYQSYYQLKSIVIALITGILLRAAVRSPADFKAVGTTVLTAALVRGTLAIYFFYVHVRDRMVWPYPQWMTNHEDSTLFVAGILVVLAWALARMRGPIWLVAAPVIAYLLLAIKVNNRRMAWFELGLALIVLHLTMPWPRLRRRLNRWILIGVPVIAAYVAVGWGRQGAIFVPLRAIHSVSGENEDSSAKARNEENLNLAVTFQQHPVMGSGWGHPYVEVSSTYTHFDSFTQYRYLPHNSLVGMVAFTGLVGLLGVWTTVPVAVFLTARSCRAARSPVEQAAALAACCFLPVYAMQAFGDMGVQSLTAGLLFSGTIAVAGRVPAWSGAWPEAGARRTRRPLRPAEQDGVGLDLDQPLR